MQAQISIVIPTLNAAAHLPATLEALMEGLHAGLIRELIISDGGSTDATLAIADAAGAEIVTGPPSRGGQLRRGCDVVRGNWILVVHADTQLSPGWTSDVSDHLSNGAGAAYFRLQFHARGVAPVLVAGWANLRAAVFGLPYGDQGLLLSRHDYTRVGGFLDQPLMEDVALARALRRHRIRLATLTSHARTSAERFQRVGWLRRGARNWWTLVRYFAGVSPERLAEGYRR